MSLKHKGKYLKYKLKYLQEKQKIMKGGHKELTLPNNLDMINLDDKIKIIKIHVKNNLNDKENIENKLNSWIKQNPIVYMKYDSTNGSKTFPYFDQFINNKLNDIEINEKLYTITNILNNKSIEKIDIIKIDLLDEIKKNENINEQISYLINEIQKLKNEFKNHYHELPTSGIRNYSEDHPYFKKN
jgi:ribosomal protein S15P/S13E